MPGTGKAIGEAAPGATHKLQVKSPIFAATFNEEV